MPKIISSIKINSPIERVFDLSRSIDFHAFTQTHKNEVAIEGKTSGLINLGETVTWRAKHFGITQKLSVAITKMERPYHFRDTMLKGAFKRFDHDHIFEQNNGSVILTDVFDYQSPFSFVGKIFDSFILEDYMKKFFEHRNNWIKETLETGAWEKFLNN